MGQGLSHFDQSRLTDCPEADVLASFKCPFKQHHWSLDTTLQSKWNCPFGHWGTPNSKKFGLIPIPQRFCIDFLQNKCTSTKLERLNPGQIVKCESGYHPSRQDIIDPEQFVPFMTEAILGKLIELGVEKLFPELQQADCVICLSPIPTLSSPTNGCVLYGILENCSHKFCSKCILEWRTNRQTLDRTGHPLGTEFFCPTCRRLSSRIMLWPVHFHSTLTLHLMQNKFFKLIVDQKTSVCIKQVEAQDHLVELRFKNHFFKFLISEFGPVNVKQTVQPDLPIQAQPEEPLKTRNADNTSVQTQLQVPLDPNVLTKFQCLLQHQDRPHYCSLQSTCPFGHHDREIDATNDLRPLLQCFCLEFLLNKCASTKLERLNPGEMVKCDSGFHPSPQELLEPENFARQLAAVVQGFSASARNELFKQLRCGKCQIPIATVWYSQNDYSFVGLLENCVHCYCYYCIIHYQYLEYIDSNPLTYDFGCDMCGTTSLRVMLWPSPVHSPTLKAHLFKLQKECFGLLVCPHTKAVIKQEEIDDTVAQLLFELNGRICHRRLTKN